MTNIRPQPISRSRGFTLVELLVTITIIIGLAGIAFLGTKTLLARAAAAKDMTNMRTIWTSVVLYAADNTDTMPGPLVGGQRALYGAKTSGRVSYYLAPYMGYTDPKVNDYLEAMGSTSWQKTEAQRNAPCYMFRNKVPVEGSSETILPWGNILLSPVGQPMKLTTVTSRINPSKTWAITDVDQLHPDVGASGWKAEVPSGMAHGSYRLAMYFDGSGGKVNKYNLPL